MVSHGAFIFHIYIPWGKTLSLVSKSRLPVKVKYQKNSQCGASVFHKHSFFLSPEHRKTAHRLGKIWSEALVKESP